MLKVIREIKENNISVILNRVHRLPKNEDSKIDEPFKQAKILSDNNILFSFSYAGDMEAMGSRNLPFTAGTAVSYGLNYEQAIKALTLNTAKILGIDKKEPSKEIVKQEFKPAVPRREDDKKEDVDNDYKYSRENYYNLIERGQEAIDGILDIAREGQHPRAYEVAGQLIGQVAGTVDKLQDLQKKLKDLKELPKTANANIKNALFVGSTAELQKMLNKKTVETNSERKKENENFEGKNITPEKTNTKD